MQAQQLSLPGLGPAVDPLVLARAECAQLEAAWKAVAGILDSPERSRLQPLYFAALINVERLTMGPQWWHPGVR